MAADGSCQFNAFIRAMKKPFYPFTTARTLREAVVLHLRNSNNWADFLEREGSLEESKERYLSIMSRANVWGDNITLQAMGELANTRVVVTRRGLGSEAITTVGAPQTEEVATVFLLFYEHQQHYSALI